jgi:hypothetical protein
MARSIGAGTLVAGAGALLACSYLLTRPRDTRGTMPRRGTMAER